MNRNQFEILVYIEENKNIKLTQRNIAEALNISVGTVNKNITSLESQGFITVNNSIFTVTEIGYTALEPYKVKRALIMAAGFGSRMVPLTLNTPKPLIRVNGKRIIDTLIDGLLEHDINEIIIVRGYLKEQFDTLIGKYPMLKFVDNDDFNIANNISSAIKVKDMFENAIVLDSDLILSDTSIIRKYEYSSNYRAIKVDRTDDWCFKTTGVSIDEVMIGGTDTYQMIGFSYWNKEDGHKLCSHLQEIYDAPGGKERFWDEVALTYKKEDYKIEVYPIGTGSIVEVDTFDELCEIDSSYRIV